MFRHPSSQQHRDMYEIIQEKKKREEGIRLSLSILVQVQLDKEIERTKSVVLNISFLIGKESFAIMPLEYLFSTP